MNHQFLILYLFLIITSCTEEESNNISCEADIITPSENESNQITSAKTLDHGSLFDECVSIENISSSNNNFVMLFKGSQEQGMADGIKINEQWKTSVFLQSDDSIFSIFMVTYWDDLPNSSITGEVISIANIPSNNAIGCYNLTSEVLPSDSIFCGYRVDEYDINLVRYELDESKENKLEILEYDPVNMVVKGKFKASFVTDEPDPNSFPEAVRFFNVDFETY